VRARLLGILIRPDLLLLVETTTLPRVKVIGRNDPQAISDLRVLTGLGHLQDVSRTPPIFFWGGHLRLQF
jgi:hypothetical protein